MVSPHTSTSCVVGASFDPNLSRLRGRLLESLDKLLEDLRGRLLLLALLELLLLLFGQRPLAHATDRERLQLLLSDFLDTNREMLN